MLPSPSTATDVGHMKVPLGADSSASSGGIFWPYSAINCSSGVNTVTRLQGKKAGVSVPRLNT